MKTKLKEILQYYSDNYDMDGATVEDVYNELLNNDVEIKGDSFFCTIYDEQLAATILLAGTKEKADVWVLKKIIKLLRTGEPVISMFNGNSDNLLPLLKGFNHEVVLRKGDVTYIKFN